MKKQIEKFVKIGAAAVVVAVAVAVIAFGISKTEAIQSPVAGYQPGYRANGNVNQLGTTNVAVVYQSSVWTNWLRMETSFTNFTPIQPYDNNLNLTWQSQCAAANTGTNGVSIFAGPIGATGFTNVIYLFTWGIINAGNTMVASSTNLTLVNGYGGYPCYYIGSITNGGVGALTNATITLK